MLNSHFAECVCELSDVNYVINAMQQRVDILLACDTNGGAESS